MSKPNLKIASVIEAGEAVVGVRDPFKLRKDNKRRFIRLEISNPISYSMLKDRSGGFWPQGDGPSYEGTILNLSAGGLLALSETPLEEGALVIMTMTLQEVEVIDRILGTVKRVESDEDAWLIGIEFISRESLSDYVSSAEMDVISEDIVSFDERLRKVLNKYVYYRRVSSEEK